MFDASVHHHLGVLLLYQVACQLKSIQSIDITEELVDNDSLTHRNM
jgi:hypothetical protein